VFDNKWAANTIKQPPFAHLEITKADLKPSLRSTNLKEYPKANVHTPGPGIQPIGKIVTQTEQSGNQSPDVVYWAGMRVEGPLRPFHKRD